MDCRDQTVRWDWMRTKGALRIAFGKSNENTHTGRAMKNVWEFGAVLAKQLEDYAAKVKNKGLVVMVAFVGAWLCALGLLIYGLYKL